MLKHTLPPPRPVIGIYTHNQNLVTHLTALIADFNFIQLHPEKFDPRASIDYCCIDSTSLIYNLTAPFDPDPLLSQLKTQTNVEKIIILLPTLVQVKDTQAGHSLSGAMSSLVSRLEIHFPQKIRLLLLEADLSLLDHHLQPGLLTHLISTSRPPLSLHPTDQIRPWGIIGLNQLWPIIQQLLVGFYPGTYNLKISTRPSHPLVNWLLPSSHPSSTLASLLHLSLPQQQEVNLPGINSNEVIMPQTHTKTTPKTKPKKNDPPRKKKVASKPKLRRTRLLFILLVSAVTAGSLVYITSSQTALKRAQWLITQTIKNLPFTETTQQRLSSQAHEALTHFLNRHQDSRYQEQLIALTQTSSNRELATQLEKTLEIGAQTPSSSHHLSSLKSTSEASAKRQSLIPLISLLRQNTPLAIAFVGLNPAEMRPGGGLIEAVITGTLAGGAFSNISHYTTAKLDGLLGGVVEPPPLVEQHLKQSRFYLRDANIYVTAAENARQTAWFLEKEINYIPDVIIFASRQTLAGSQLLNDQTIWENFYHNLSAPASSRPDQFQTSIINQLLEGVGRGEVQIITHPLIRADSFPPIPLTCPLTDCYYLPLYVSELNTGLNQSNVDISRALAQTIDVSLGGITQTIKLTIHHQGKGEWPSGEYQALASVSKPSLGSVQSIRVGDSYLSKNQITISPDQSGDRLWIPLRVLPGKSIVIEWVIFHPQVATSIWGTITKQPGIEPYPITLNITTDDTVPSSGIWTAESELSTHTSFYVDSQTGLW